MERSNYFGLLRDLYHFDHFMGKSRLFLACCVSLILYRCTVTTMRDPLAGAFANYLPVLLADFAAYDIVSCEEDEETATVRVSIKDSTQQEVAQYRFQLARKLRGRSAGSWMTVSLVRCKT